MCWDVTSWNRENLDDSQVAIGSGSSEMFYWAGVHDTMSYGIHRVDPDVASSDGSGDVSLFDPMDTIPDAADYWFTRNSTLNRTSGGFVLGNSRDPDTAVTGFYLTHVNDSGTLQSINLVDALSGMDSWGFDFLHCLNTSYKYLANLYAYRWDLDSGEFLGKGAIVLVESDFSDVDFVVPWTGESVSFSERNPKTVAAKDGSFWTLEWLSVAEQELSLWSPDGILIDSTTDLGPDFIVDIGIDCDGSSVVLETPVE